MAAPAFPHAVLSGGLENKAPASGTAFELQARSGTPTAVIIGTPEDAEGLVVVLHVTAVTANTVTLNIEGVDRSGNVVYTILTSAATGVADVIMRVSANITAAANTIAQDLLPSEIQIRPVHSDGNPITYSVGVHFTS